jgi:hypothetical protein
MAMLSSNAGKAILFAKKLLQRTQDLRNEWELVNALATDDLVFLVERMLDVQDRFIEEGKPHSVDIGYHYTKDDNIERIRTDGLLTRQDRRGKSIFATRENGSFFGDGIYTSNNPVAFRSMGEIGLLVARLKGRSVRIVNRYEIIATPNGRCDTIIGNKSFSRVPSFTDEIVLKASPQALPLIKYPAAVISSDYGNGETPVTKYHKMLQELVDEFFNIPISTVIRAECSTW